MRTILFYDTETTGLPNWKAPSNDPSQPYITQLAAELWDEESGNTLASMGLIIKPDGWTISEEVEELTGISTELATRFGVPIASALDVFLDMWSMCDLRAAHNETFDMRMIRIAIMRSAEPGLADHWKAGETFCTQARSTKILNLPPTAKMVAAKRFHAKSPNLSEAYQFFTGTELKNAHNAAVDVAACKTVYQGIAAHEQVLA